MLLKKFYFTKIRANGVDIINQQYPKKNLIIDIGQNLKTTRTQRD